MSLNTKPNIADADGFYAALLAAHRGLTEAQSLALDAELILILANHIGDREVLDEALMLARKGKG
ncbi:DUF2783 domain-containing protein [Ostreiculturibacter nitratireducens]|uniref:DUF2783 domain-containing protein n=1 Tax=Ostreiculturibacter nitratireducens TaxID=3075226 RepID=UPI0031B5AE36